MQTRLLTALAVAVGTTLSMAAQASSDNFCYPNWSVFKTNLDVCSSLPFLHPGNDSEVNLRLLLANAKVLALQPAPLNADDLEEGYGEVPFAAYRLQPAATAPDAQGPAQLTVNGIVGLADMLATLGIKREATEVAGDSLVDGEGSRCRSNNETTATWFIRELIKTAELAPAERAALATSRMQMLSACGWEPEQISSLLPTDIKSPTAKAFVTYLQAAADFYSGRFVEANKNFTLLADNPQEWLKETALYMLGRSELNLAQQNAFEYGELKSERVDPNAAQRAESALLNYVDSYPFGYYSTSATGLLRRVHWLLDDFDKLAVDYEKRFYGQGDDEPTEPELQQLIHEADIKLITINGQAVNSPTIAAVNDLMWMRERYPKKLDKAELLAQKDTFAEQPELFVYLQAVFALYVENDPDAALKLLPGDMPNELNYLAFSQQVLRGLALQAGQDWQDAEAHWLKLLPLTTLPLQRQQVELALAMAWERDQQLSEVFAADSPIRSEKVRYILLSKAADAQLLRQQVKQGPTDTERNTALFVLLYKDLLRGQYAAFADDLKQLPAAPSPDKLGYSLGYTYSAGQALTLFQWKGDNLESGYVCPTIAESAAALEKDPKNPQGLNCLGEFILRNKLDGMPLDQPRQADLLGGTAPGYSGEIFSRHTGYQTVIANPKASHDDKAYALFRAIYCYAPAGINSCGGKEVDQAARKAWFKQLKSGYADTRWDKALQYYW